VVALCSPWRVDTVLATCCGQRRSNRGEAGISQEDKRRRNGGQESGSGKLFQGQRTQLGGGWWWPCVPLGGQTQCWPPVVWEAGTEEEG
jgi:hypothetical protein